MKKIVLFLTFMSVLSCTEKIEKPEKFLEKEEMTNLLYELSLITSAQTFYSQDTLVKVISSQNILAKHKLDSISFVEINDYYIQQPQVYAEIFDSINERLKRKIKEVENLPEDPRDTIGRGKIMNMKVLKDYFK